MTNEEEKILRQVFSTYEGEKALDIIRKMSGYDTRTSFQADERKQTYDLGRASLFADIFDILTPTKKGKKDGRTDKSYIDE